MKSVATIKLKIKHNKLLLETMGQYSKAVQYIADKALGYGICNRYRLHHLVYYQTREHFKLPSQFTINAIRVASQTLKSVKTNKGSHPRFKEMMPLAFDKRNSTWHGDKIRLATLQKPITIDLNIPEYYWKYLDWNYQTALLVKDKQRMFLHITLSRDINIDKISNRLQVGVDAGINHVAVTSNRRFFSGKKIKSYRIKFKRLRARLQSKGTRSAQKRLKAISGRERRFKAYWNHVISKQIVSNCSAGTIVLENLKDIRKQRLGKRMNFWLNGWSFFQLQNFITYKANRVGINVVKISPYLTSQTCSKCGSLGFRSKGFFVCHDCNYSLNADLNASYNLAKHHSMTDGVLGSVTNPHIQSDEHKAISGIACKLMDNQSKSVKPHILM
ncbi:IS200/IS605 family element transposase accessory protein TnpB [Candidatus Pacearchaeota archaeon]|nr:IS200/IS605 family element transposase accessory protein TnpB [Candidatus Pacearchaeota archaeon]